MVVDDEWIVAACLDPAQIKSNILSAQLEKKNSTIRETLIKFIQQTEIEQNSNRLSSSSSSITNIERDPQAIGPAKRLRLEMLQELASEEISENSDNYIELEIDQYLFIASTYPKHEDVMQFWKQNKQTLPNLHKLVRQILGLSLTSSACEHAFSLSGTLLNKKRSKLNPVIAHKQLFINANYNVYASQRQNQ